jgi:cell division initiation protein
MLNSNAPSPADTFPSEADTRKPALADRNLAVSPIDMRQARFGSAMRGFDRSEVTTFLLEASEAYEQALRDNDRLRHEVGRLEAALAQHRELEHSLKTTLMSAQKVADDMRENAAAEATRLVREAEGRAELLVNRAHARAEDVQREIDGLRLKRREAETSIEATISALHNTLEFVREQDVRERRVEVAG